MGRADKNESIFDQYFYILEQNKLDQNLTLLFYITTRIYPGCIYIHNQDISQPGYTKCRQNLDFYALESWIHWGKSVDYQSTTFCFSSSSWSSLVCIESGGACVKCQQDTGGDQADASSETPEQSLGFRPNNNSSCLLTLLISQGSSGQPNNNPPTQSTQSFIGYLDQIDQQEQGKTSIMFYRSMVGGKSPNVYFKPFKSSI